MSVTIHGAGEQTEIAELDAGLGCALMEAVEARARADGRWLLILDTEAGTPADALYRSMGWQELGTMPNHAFRVDGVLAPTTYFWKNLRSEQD